MGTGVRAIVPLTLGYEDLPKSVSVEGAHRGERLLEPVPGLLLRCDGGWLLVDTGFNMALINDPVLRKRFHPDPEEQPVLPGPGEPLEDELGKAGIDMGEIYAVAVSHLHLDHAGGLKHFAGKVPVHVQRAELDYGMNAPHPEPERHGIYRIDFDDPRIDWRRSDGDAVIAPGVTAVLTAGHTPGHQSFVVDIDQSGGGGGFVFAFDAADLAENIEQELPIGSRVGVPPAATIEPIRRLKRIAAERGYHVVPGHDPVAWPALTRECAARWPA
jgi:N-acyl homoserine lactone hydrolase